MDARPFINSLDFAKNGRKISGEVPVAEFSRLHDMLESQQGSLKYKVIGGVDNQDHCYLDVSVTGGCQLSCQRCLEGMDHPVWIATRLLLCEQDKLNALGDDVMIGGEDALDSILAEERLDVLNLLEEEIILSLPIAPRHESGACQAAGGNKMQLGERHPFAVLANLKRN